jgi:hypothetical protein
MTVDCYNDYEENKLSSCAHLLEIGDFKYSSPQIKVGRICCGSTKNDNNKGIKPTFSEVASPSYKTTTVRPTTPDTVTPTSSTTNRQAESTLYAFYYYQITGQERKCSCYVCADLAAFKPKKQNDASLVYVTKKTSQEESPCMTVFSPPGKEDFEIRVYLAKVNNATNKFCSCPHAKAGKIDIDISAHERNCRIRKKLVSKGYVVDTSVTPEDFKDGYSLGVAI